MKISTKGQYSLKIMIYLANRYEDNKFISLKKISDDEGISLKYLEKLIAVLNKYDYFISSRGIDGGYKLKRHPKDYSVGEILSVAEGSIAPVSCVEHGFICPSKDKCSTYKIWNDLNDAINKHLNNKTLEDYRKKA